jgi:hypothetical protein
VEAHGFSRGGKGPRKSALAAVIAYPQRLKALLLSPLFPTPKGVGFHQLPFMKQALTTPLNHESKLEPIRNDNRRLANAGAKAQNVIGQFLSGNYEQLTGEAS